MDYSDDQHGQLRLGWGAFLVGFALGGFFDGILLHQVLQWHHLLSGVAPTDTVADLRFQVLADGAFHVLHYVAASVGLWLILSRHRALGHRFSGRRLVGWSLVGFGAWHCVDAVVAHWLLQIHRIRMDVQNPLLWDLGWLIPFGILPLVAGVYLLRSPPPDGGGVSRPSSGKAIAGAMMLSVVIAGPVAALPPANFHEDNKTLVVFRPGVSFADIVAATEAVDGRMIWTDRSEKVWLLAIGPDASPATLYAHGALLVGSGPVAVGCLSWSNV